MSVCDEIDENNYTSCKCDSRTRVSLCNCSSNTGCLDRGACNGLQPTGTAVTGACPGLCQCAEEEIWNNVPPKPNCRWYNNFTELRRQWSDHSRQQVYKCYSCSQSCRTVVSCSPCLSTSPPCSGTISLTSDCQKCCGSRRLAGGASKSEMAPADKSSSDSPKREAGGGCPPPNCHPSTSYNSPSADCASTVSSCCPSQCRYSQTSSHRAFNSQPCTLKPILKERSCGQCNVTNHSCLCQPMPRSCNCPPPVQVDAWATPECACDCNPSSPECACSPVERRFPKATVKCPNARLSCPSPRLPSNLKCYSSSCQSCPPPPCDSCTFSKCQRPIPLKNFYSPCSACSPCQPVSTALPCRLSTPCRKLTFCAKHNERSSSSSKGVSCTSEKMSSANVQINKEKNKGACCNVFSNLGDIGYSTLVPNPLALISFALLIFIAVTWSSGSAFYRCYLSRKRISWKHLSL